ncbi:MAG: T9SS type A sorting domain-containing protein, partial [Caldithrix sp.]|nr:T9SS type A sorting domain-containing protein [Caldithrix sp.]
STELFDDGLSNDGQANDGIWGSDSWISDFPEDHFKVNLITHDFDENTRHSLLWEPERFTTKGPISVVDFDTAGYISKFNAQRINLIVQNSGLSAKIQYIKVKISTKDPRIDHISTPTAGFPGLAAGAIDTLESSHIFNFASGYHPDSTIGNPVKFNAEIYSNNRLFWTDSIDVEIITDISSKHTRRIPRRFALEQNYPNPFNPVTKIIYQLAKTDKVKLTIFDTRGREIQTLVNKRQTAGQHEITFNAEHLSSGVYFYQLTTKTGYREARKMIVLK